MAVADLPHPLEVAVLRHEAAAAVLHRLEDHRRDRLGPGELDRLLDRVGGPQRIAVLAPPVGVRVGDVHAARGERFEGHPQRRQAGGRERAHGGAVVGELAGDELVPARFAAGGVVGLRELPGRLHGLRAAGGEEDAVEAAGGELGDARGQFDRARVRVAPVGVERQLPGLRGGRLSELRATVPDVHAVQRRQAVQIAFAVLVVHVATLAAYDHRHLVIGVGAHPREVHPQMLLCLLLQIARHPQHHPLASGLDTKDNANSSSSAPQCAAWSTCLTSIVRDVQVAARVLGITPIVRFGV